MEENKRKMKEAQEKLDEERLAMVEQKRLMHEERLKMEEEKKKRSRLEQNVILNKKNARPKLSFSLKS